MNIVSQTLSAMNTSPKANNPIDLAGVNGFAAAAGTKAIENVAGPGFGDVMTQMAGSVMNKLGQAESVSLKAVQGEANTREVVDALMTAEQSLNTAIAIRDKIVTAYLDISRMQI